MDDARTYTYPRVSIHSTKPFSLSPSLSSRIRSTLIFLHTVSPMYRLSLSLSLILHRAFLPSSFYAYYLPAKCTFHSRDFLSTLPPLFFLHSSPFPISSRFPDRRNICSPRPRLNTGSNIRYYRSGKTTLVETFRNFRQFLDRFFFPISKPMPAREQIFKATALVSSDKVLATPFSFFRQETKPFA